jgi:hypothetical protein
MDYQQDLFYSNIPRDGKNFSTKLGFLQSELVDFCFLSEVTTPYYIYTGTNRIVKLENLIYSEKIANKINKLGLGIYLYEPMCLRKGDGHNCSFYSEFKNTDTDILSDELDSIEIFIRNNNLTNVNIYTSDYNIKRLQSQYPNLNLYCLDIFLRHRLVRNKKSNNEIKKKFWCGNWRYTAHRHLVMSYLVNLDGNYSWNVKCDSSILKSNAWFDVEQSSRKARLLEGADILKDKVFSIDQTLSPVSIESAGDVYIPGGNSPKYTDRFSKSYTDSFCAVINETRYAQPLGYFSEKTLSAMYHKLPILLVAPPRSLEYLKTFGFKTFDHWWDESYDLEEDHQTRLEQIFDIIDFINSKSLDELCTMYEEMLPIIEHNLSLINTIPYNSTVL